MAGTFRHPAWMSRVTLLAGLVAAARVTHTGLPLLERIFQLAGSDRAKRRMLKGYIPSERDLFVATYPKSGTNWAMQMATQLAWAGEAEFKHIHDLVPWPDAAFPHIAALEDRGWQAAPHPLHVIKTSAKWSHLPITSGARFLAVIRDPKEVVVSSYHFILGIFDLKDQVSPEAWVELFLSDSAPGGPWADHTASVWQQRHRDNVKVLMFPRIKEDLTGAVDEVAAFVGIDLPAAGREAVVARCGLPWMKAHESRFSPPILKFRRSAEPTKMIRRGVSGDSRELLSRALRQAVDDWTIQRLRTLGSDFPYEAWFAET